jgi:phosphoribosylanthranilate isomerase
MTVVKICGITNLDDALCAVEAGADMLGFIFYPKSPRCISVEAAAEIARAIRQTTTPGSKSQLILVGVFVNESPVHMLRVLDDAGLDVAQLSGQESPDDLAAMRGRAYKAIREWREASPSFMHATRAAGLLPDLLLDANHSTLYGGSGQRADESLAVHLARHYRLMLAGGLTPDNVADAVRVVQPWGVDVASGVEAAPGKKDHHKVHAFVAAAKATHQSE